MYTNFFSYGNSYWTDMSVCISVSEGDNFFSASETREKMLGFFFCCCRDWGELQTWERI